MSQGGLKQHQLFAEATYVTSIVSPMCKGWTPRPQVFINGPSVGCAGNLFDPQKLQDYHAENPPAPVLSGTRKVATSASFESFADQKAMQLEVGGRGKAFGASLSASLAMSLSSQTSKSSEAYYMDDSTSYVVATLNNPTKAELRHMLRPAAKGILDNGDWGDVLDLGLFYLQQGSFGAFATYTATTSKSEFSSKQEAEAAFKLNVQGIGYGAKVEANANWSSAELKSESNMSMYRVAAGGDPKFFLLDQQEQWHESAKKNPVLVSFHLGAVWELASSPERREELQKLFAKHTKEEGARAQAIVSKFGGSISSNGGFKPVSSQQIYFIENVNGLVLGIRGAGTSLNQDPGGQICTWTKNDNWDKQWKLTPHPSGGKGVFYIENVNGLALAIGGAGTSVTQKPGRQICTWTKNDNWDKQWKLTPI